MATLEYFTHVDNVESLKSDIKNIKNKIQTEKIRSIYDKLSVQNIWQTTGNYLFLKELKNLIEQNEDLKKQINIFTKIASDIQTYKEKESKVKELEKKITKEERKEKSSKTKIENWKNEKKILLNAMKEIILSIESKLS
ncbi:MAG: hypothetical protein HFH86_01885 [Bacilli bacterium]|jgi:hypothetical protein|nr:hypothetical protein [Bacilli bacterium]